MSRRFEGRRAVVTGGSRGLGLAIAERLADEGAHIILAARGSTELTKAAAKITSNGGSAQTLAVDLGSPAGCQELADFALHDGQAVDVLINNAGITDEAPVLEITYSGWRHVLAVMLDAPFLLSQSIGRSMAAAGRGSIVNITSIDGHAADGPFASYAVAKAGLIMLTKNVAVELAASGVRCNAVSPGWTHTALLEESTSPAAFGTLKADFNRVPLKRLLEPAEIASACAFLASDEASGVTGTELVVDGGLTADLYVIPTLASD